MSNFKIMVTTYPFGETNDTPIVQLLGHSVVYNDLKRKYTREELVERLVENKPDIIIAGTEKYDNSILDLIPNLKMISRVGIGLDSIPIEECRSRSIKVAYTPDAPSNAVAELTIGQMINMARRVQTSHSDISNGVWSRYIGKEIRNCTIGIIGCGRIGRLVIEKLEGLKPRRIYANDLIYQRALNLPRVEYSKKMQIMSECDIISVHIPWTEENDKYISSSELSIMKKDVMLVNMSRGGVFDEDALFNFLSENKEATASIDTFENEPYNGNLTSLRNAYLTPHLGSCSHTSRFHMEVGAVEEVLNYINNKDLVNEVC
jgi:D-3-phosphoglycerate dehydrogenase